MNKIRYNSGYNPFSFKFDSSLNKALYNEAKNNNASVATLNIIDSGEYFFSKFHRPLFEELQALRKKIPLLKDDLVELIISCLNQQEFMNRDLKQEFINSLEQVTALDLQQATATRDDMPNNPQNFTHLSEATVEFANLLVGYIYYDEHMVESFSISLPIENLFNHVTKMIRVANIYHNIKSHYESCLFYDGDIQLLKPNQIYFDACTNDFCFIQQISFTIIENQRLNRMQYYDHHPDYNAVARSMAQSDKAMRTLSKAVSENGFVKFLLRKRNPDDYSVYVDFMASLIDYYPFYSIKRLEKLKGLTISQILKIQSELTNLTADLYLKKTPKNKWATLDKFKIDFLPRIKHSVLKSYMVSITGIAEHLIDVFLQLSSYNPGSGANLFSTYLL